MTPFGTPDYLYAISQSLDDISKALTGILQKLNDPYDKYLPVLFGGVIAFAFSIYAAIINRKVTKRLDAAEKKTEAIIVGLKDEFVMEAMEGCRVMTARILENMKKKGDEQDKL